MTASVSFWDAVTTGFMGFFQLKLPQIQKIMMEFEKQSEIMDMKEEMMNDAIDDAMGDEEDEEERCVYDGGQLWVHKQRQWGVGASVSPLLLSS